MTENKSSAKYWEEKYCDLYDQYQLLKRIAVDMDYELQAIKQDRKDAKMLRQAELMNE